jgi:adenylate cyclase
VQAVPDADHADALVRRNFAFIDLCGFTMLTDERGVGEAVAALSTFRAVVRERAGWRGVRVAKWLGDGAMLVATEPRPILDAVIRMEQALDLRGCPLPLRGGVAAGRVILFEGDDYIGRPVNLAARLCDDAEPHQLLVTASLYEAAGEGLSARRLGPHRIRGFTRPVEVVDLSQGDHRAPLPRPSRMVGPRGCARRRRGAGRLSAEHAHRGSRDVLGAGRVPRSGGCAR